MADQRTVELRLNISMPPDAKRALEESARQMGRATAANEQLNTTLAATGKAARESGQSFAMMAVDAMRISSGIGNVSRMPRSADRATGLRDVSGASGGPVGMAASSAMRDRVGELMRSNATSAAFDRQLMSYRGALGVAAGTYGLKHVGESAEAMYGAQALSDLGGTQNEATRKVIDSTFLTRNTAGIGLDIWDSISGRNAAIAKVGRRSQEQQVEMSVREQQRLRENELYRERTMRARESVQIGFANLATPAPTVSQFDRNTIVGERQYREATQLNPFRERVTQAEGAEAGARSNREFLESHQMELQRRRRGLEQDARFFGAQAGDLKGAEREKAIEAEKQKRQEIASALAEETRVMEQAKKAREQEIQAIKDRKQAETELKQAQLQQLRQREQVAVSQARGLGQTNEFDYQQAKQAAEMVRQAGTAGAMFLPDEIRQRARQFAPEMAGQLDEEIGRQRRERDRLQDQFPEFRDDAAKIKREVQKLQDEITLKVRVDTEDFKQQMAEQAKAIGPIILDIFNSLLANELAKLKQQQLGQARGTQKNQ